MSEQHSDDIAVDAFAKAMKSKLAKKRSEGRGGWERCAPIDLAQMFVEHIAKGDPVDLANFCMFLHQLPNAHRPSIRQAYRLAMMEYVNENGIASVVLPK